MTAPCCPALARRVRLRFDGVRNAHVLLAPEAVVVLTPEAYDVLSLCTGTRDVDGIVSALRSLYPEAPADTLREDTVDLLFRLTERGYVVEPG